MLCKVKYTMHKLLIPLIIFLFVVSSGVIYAREGNNSGSGSSGSSGSGSSDSHTSRSSEDSSSNTGNSGTGGNKNETKLEFRQRTEDATGRKEIRREFESKLKDNKIKVKEKFREKVSSHSGELFEDQQEAHLRFASRAAEIEDEIKKRHEELKDLREEHHALLKEKLKAIRDKRKAEIAERVDQRLNEINRNRTTSMARHLSQMSMLLEKIDARIASASASGKNTASASAALAAAESKIAQASTAVGVQAGKDYTVTVSTESALRKDVQASRDLLHTDLKATHQTVVDARKAVIDVIRLLAGLGGS